MNKAVRIIRGVHNIQPRDRGCVATIGNFDGVHPGHAMILERLLAHARQEKRPACVLTFEPHPQEFFAQDLTLSRLSRFGAKATLLAQQGIEQILVLRFNKKLMALAAKDFIKNILVDGIGVKHLVVGDDFRFGKDRAGDAELLRSLGKTFGYTVNETDTHREDQERVSSTLLRQLLANGEIAQANQVLGREYSISGKVRRGDQLARSLGFPTANIALGKWNPPLRGVFAVHCQHQAQIYQGVANLGVRPTVDGKRLVLEVHVFNFSGDLYDKKLQVSFLKKLRAETAFPSISLLKQQISQDIADAKAFFVSDC